MKVNPDYKLHGSVLGNSFEEDVYAQEGWTEEDIIHDLVYLYSEGNFGCDCTKLILAGVDGWHACGDNIKYESLTLIYKNERVIDILKQGWFGNENP